MIFNIIQVDIPIKYLSFFLEDDAELEHMKKVRLLSTSSRFLNNHYPVKIENMEISKFYQAL